MTVRDLIQHLREFSPDAKVCLWDCETQELRPADRIDTGPHGSSGVVAVIAWRDGCEDES